MSHIVPINPISGSSGSGQFSVQTDSGSITVSGFFSILGGGGAFTSGVGTTVTVNAGGAGSLSFATDAGSATPSGGVIQILGSQYISTTAASNTISINPLDDLPVRFGGTGRGALTSHGVLIGEGTSPINTTVGTSGQVLIGATGADPSFSTITSTGGTITFTMGPNSLNIEVASSLFTFSGSISTSTGGTGRTVLTTFGVLIGAGSNSVNVTAPGTNGQVLIASTTGDPKFSTITSTGGTVTFTVGPNSLNIEVTSAAFTFSNAVSVVTGGTGRTVLTTFGVLIGEGSNGVNVTAPGTSGQVLIASTTGDPKFSTITSTGGTVTFTVGPNSLNI
ncbi:MAG: hypothetical protein Q8L98_06780, partial [Chlamydiales bacterium]|nr:hypothetical protein [Chlamydiales bacterium]